MAAHRRRNRATDHLRRFNEMPVGKMAIDRRHAANTAGILWHPQTHLDMVRPGLSLFGHTPVPERETSISLQPAMSLTTKVVHLKTVKKGESVSYGDDYRTQRDSRLAILPIGYAHGYNRRLSNTGEVIIHDQRFPIVGRICMDMTVVDVTGDPTIKPGDEVILMGKSETQAITAYDLAMRSSAISASKCLACMNRWAFRER